MTPLSHERERRYYMPESFVLIPASDLRMIELTCPFCKKAKVVIDVQDAETNALPEACPGCKKTWNGFTNSNSLTAIQGLKKFFSTLVGTDMNPQFRIKEE